MTGEPARTDASAEPLSAMELAALIRLAQSDDTVALALTGSYPRGEATRHSDVDLLRFVETEPTRERDRYRLSVVAGRLVSLSTTTLASKRTELARPETAIWAVEGLRQARILVDRDGELGALLAQARAFVWTPDLRRAADSYASEMLAGLAEEVCKLLGALQTGDDSAAVYATLGLQQGLTRAALVAHGVLLRSENAYFAESLRLDGAGSRWERLLRVVIGYDAPEGDVSLPRGRGKAALWLYVEAARLLRRAVSADDAGLIAATVSRIEGELAGG